MVDEVYLQKAAQYHSGEYVGALYPAEDCLRHQDVQLISFTIVFAILDYLEHDTIAFEIPGAKAVTY